MNFHLYKGSWNTLVMYVGALLYSYLYTHTSVFHICIFFLCDAMSKVQVVIHVPKQLCLSERAALLACLQEKKGISFQSLLLNAPCQKSAFINGESVTSNSNILHCFWSEWLTSLCSDLWLCIFPFLLSLFCKLNVIHCLLLVCQDQFY